MNASQVGHTSNIPVKNRSGMKKGTEWIKRATAHEYFPVLLLIVLNLTLGLASAHHYGEAIDEHYLYTYGDNSLSFYTSWIDGKVPASYGPTNLRFYGPSYLILGTLLTKTLRFFFPSWLEVDLWHWVNFLAFQVGLLFLYSLSRRLVGKLAAFAGVLLLCTQPLLWGHAFINPKDIPFLVFFLAAVASGVRMVDTFAERNQESLPRQAKPSAETGKVGLKRLVPQDWVSTSPISKKALIISGGILAIILLVWFAGAKWLIPSVIQWLYSLDPGSSLGALFARLAENIARISPEMYILKALRLFNRVLLASALLLLSLVMLFGVVVFRSSLRWLWKQYGSLIWAGLLLGLCTSIRVLGPAAGLLVAGYFLLKIKLKSLRLLASYFALALLVAYLTWPYLWASPISRYLESLQIMSEFPWEGKVLFNGVYYKADELPRSYLPVLLSVQFTIPTLVMFLIGVFAAVRRSYRHTISESLVIVLAAWLILPLSVVILARPVMYDNFRQFLFIIPPIFIFAGVGFECLFSKFRIKLISILIVLVAILPGIYWSFRLHPYQYVYYNQIVGGVRGSFRKYEMDYWMTSYREATDYLNDTASANARIFVLRIPQVVKRYIRQDLVIEDDQPSCNDDYAMLTSRQSKDIDLYPMEPVVFRVGRDQAIFAVIKQIQICKSSP